MKTVAEARPFLCSHTSRFLVIWLAILPFTLYPSCKWATIPSAGLIAFLLLGIEEIGVQIEEPFSILPLGAPQFPSKCTSPHNGSLKQEFFIGTAPTFLFIECTSDDIPLWKCIPDGIYPSEMHLW
jgi:Bestrophin, RFP-TM, chloride channel